MTRIAIATATDAGYLPAACCQLKSAWEHVADRAAVRLFLVVCDVGAEDAAEADMPEDDPPMRITANIWTKSAQAWVRFGAITTEGQPRDYAPFAEAYRAQGRF